MVMEDTGKIKKQKRELDALQKQISELESKFSGDMGVMMSNLQNLQGATKLLGKTAVGASKKNRMESQLAEIISEGEDY